MWMSEEAVEALIDGYLRLAKKCKRISEEYGCLSGRGGTVLRLKMQTLGDPRLESKTPKTKLFTFVKKVPSDDETIL
jgi:hypothetical protein